MKKDQGINMIAELSNAYGVSGFEDDVVRKVKEYCHEFGEFTTDGIKNLYIGRKDNTGNRPIVQFDAHSDEVGFIVQAIKPNGLIKFLTLGGWVPSNIAAQKVRVRTTKGDYVSGVVTSKPPHFMSESERQAALTMDHLFIDLGATTKEEVEEQYGVVMGAPIVPDVTLEYKEDQDLLLGKAFDCRIGCACMVDVLDEIKSDPLDFDLVATLTAQEEVGLRGATIAAKKVNADLAIVFEGCPADDTASENYMIQSAMGKGPMLRHFDVSMITNADFQKYAVEVAKKHSIPIQLSVRSGGGTNGAAINQVKGAPTIVVGIPVRYAHTHHGYVSYQDYQHAKELVIELVRSLDLEKIKRFAEPI